MPGTLRFSHVIQVVAMNRECFPNGINQVAFMMKMQYCFHYNQPMHKYLCFKVCKSVHHRTIQINHQPDATVFQFIILTFIYGSTCFGRSHAHHQELNNCSSSLWFYLRFVVIAVLCSWSGRPASGRATRLLRSWV